MSNEVIKRILTSVIIFPILLYCTYKSGFYLISFLSLFCILALYEVFKNTKYLLSIFFSYIVLFLAFFSFYYLRGETNQSLIILYWVLISTFMSDIGGYVCGKIFKGKKLTKISPNKTYSGSIGSLFFSLVSLPLLNLAQYFFYNETIVDFFIFKYFFITLAISIICQAGDLYVSYLKRKIKIKDISRILPGHGGVLDRIDGLIFVLIFIFLLTRLELI